MSQKNSAIEKSKNERPSMRFEESNSRLPKFVGIGMFLVSVIWFFGILIVREIAGGLDILLVAYALVLFFFFFMFGFGLLVHAVVKDPKVVLLGKTKFSIQTQSGKKRFAIDYRQLINAHVVVHGTISNRRRRLREFVEIRYFPMVDDEIDTEQIKIIRIDGVKNKERLAFELRQRANPLDPISTSELDRDGKTKLYFTPPPKPTDPDPFLKLERIGALLITIYVIILLLIRLFR